MQLWCSAVEAANVDPALAEFRHESLAEKFNYEYSEKEAIVSSRLKKSNSVLTPRRASTEPPKAPTIGATAEKVASQSAQASQEVLDTPRGSLVPGQPTGQPAAAAAAAAAPPPARTAPTMPTGVPPKPAASPTPAASPKPAASPTPPTPPPSLPPPGSSPPAVDDDDTFQITVPEGVNPGDKLKATTPSGVKVLLRVPEGAGPGTELSFTLPKGTATLPKGSSSSKAAEDDTAAQAMAATRIQAKVRGKSVRQSVASARPAGAPPMPRSSNPSSLTEDGKPELVEDTVTTVEAAAVAAAKAAAWDKAQAAWAAVAVAKAEAAAVAKAETAWAAAAEAQAFALEMQQSSELKVAPPPSAPPPSASPPSAPPPSAPPPSAPPPSAPQPSAQDEAEAEEEHEDEDEDVARRNAWVQHYIKLGDYDRAVELGWDKDTGLTVAGDKLGYSHSKCSTV